MHCTAEAVPRIRDPILAHTGAKTYVNRLSGIP